MISEEEYNILIQKDLDSAANVYRTLKDVKNNPDKYKDVDVWLLHATIRISNSENYERSDTFASNNIDDLIEKRLDFIQKGYIVSGCVGLWIEKVDGY